jgi:hypothetical protein
MISRKRKISEEEDERDVKQRQRMTSYNLNHVFRKRI